MTREQQRKRTRADLLRAAGRLLKAGETPTLEQVASEALVSRATAYRYFPGIDALLAEAELDLSSPDPQRLFADGSAGSIAERLVRADDAFAGMIAEHEPLLRLMLSSAIQRGATVEDGLPVRQNRRSGVIDAAIAPHADVLDPAQRDLLAKAAAMVIGTEGFIALTDVLGLDAAEARAVRRWALEAFAAAASR